MSASKQDLDLAKEEETAKKTEQDILKKPVEWAAYCDSKSITTKERDILQSYHTQATEGRLDQFKECGVDHAALFARILTEIREKTACQYILTLVDHLLQEDPSVATYFHQIPGGYAPFLRIVQKSEDPYSAERASRVLSLLLSSDVSEDDKTIVEFMGWLTSRLSTKKGRDLTSTVGYIKDMLKRSSTQVIFVKKDGLVKLVSLLQKDATTANPQLLYLMGFCIWLLSFNPECRGDLKKNHVVKEIAKIIRISVREKNYSNLICYSKEST